MQQILVCDSWNHSVQATKWLHSKMEPRWGVKNCTLENQWSEPSGNGKPSSGSGWPHPQRTVLFCQSFLLVVEINLGKKFGGQACSRGNADQNTTEELLAQNLTILFLPPPKLQDSSVLFRVTGVYSCVKNAPTEKTWMAWGRLSPSFPVGCKEAGLWSQMGTWILAKALNSCVTLG